MNSQDEFNYTCSLIPCGFLVFFVEIESLFFSSLAVEKAVLQIAISAFFNPYVLNGEAKNKAYAKAYDVIKADKKKPYAKE